ncbi:acetoacetate--CoA ligase [Lederbergia lenta]|uniref:Acetoacetyl-CoA synthase n=1 Tax=Lederbergia lenta TaxID=1467 RepID=A0A2X4YPW1_LEDLE|nr:acetoacetate--CoA ligase [Lederbergia lenta]MEC2325810.1 acetoacetate--CoA ligase [Lederbergia lenta]SQI53715.1 acetoacetyl-CoA synthase [Lederbergia lenta]
MIKEESLLKSNILWKPSEEWILNSNLTEFSKQVEFPLLPYEHFHGWSVEQPEEFWSALWDFANIIGEKGERVLLPPADGGMLGAKWFPDASLNFAENLLSGEEGSVAVIVAGEDGISRSYTWGDLRGKVARAQEGLKSLGVSSGDRVAGVVTNGLEALVALLATTSLGAVWTSCSPDFGSQGIVDRIGQVKPKVLIVSLDYQYNGKFFDIRENIKAVCKVLEGVSAIVTLTEEVDGSIKHANKVLSWEELCQEGPTVPEYTRVPFDHPLYILYTSGTTGLPKAIVHSVGGTLIKHLNEHQLHCDVKPGDVMYWYTNTAWMMYPWLVSGLASGAAILLYDGSPLRKDHIGILWEIAEKVGVTHFGTSPKYLETLQKASYSIGQEHNLPHLRSVLSCGAPLSAEQYDWVYDHIKKDIMLASISGGTEIIGCFVMGSPVHPVRRGEITCKALGMAVDILDENGISVHNQKGDLVCTKPFPSMPLTFWGVDGDTRYEFAYFADRPGIWTHGDLAEQTAEHSLIIYGRADTTLNPGGVRIGTAEIYRVVEQIPEIEDSLVFGLPNDGDEEIVLCIVTKDGKLDDILADSIRKNVRKKASPRHVPRRIYCVKEVPYTINGKKVEGAARSAILGQTIKNKGSLNNPECLQDYNSLSERSYL